MGYSAGYEMTEPAVITLLDSSLGEADAQWLHDAVAVAATGAIDQLLERYTAAHRLGRTALAPDAAHLRQWTREDAGRLALLHGRRAHPSFVDSVIACYEQGDAREQQSWLRGLPWLPEPQRFLSQAIDACRTNILPLFESIACENPFPARFFPERNFNQLVLKALFNAVPLARIVGLDERANRDLSRMARDYADERRAAGRSVPADIGLAMTT